MRELRWICETRCETRWSTAKEARSRRLIRAEARCERRIVSCCAAELGGKRLEMRCESRSTISAVRVRPAACTPCFATPGPASSFLRPARRAWVDRVIVSEMNDSTTPQRACACSRPEGVTKSHVPALTAGTAATHADTDAREHQVACYQTAADEPSSAVVFDVRRCRRRVVERQSRHTDMYLLAHFKTEAMRQ